MTQWNACAIYRDEYGTLLLTLLVHGKTRIEALTDLEEQHDLDRLDVVRVVISREPGEPSLSDGKIDREALVREMEAAWLRAPENARSAREAELCRMAAALAVAEEAIRDDERERCAQIVQGIRREANDGRLPSDVLRVAELVLANVEHALTSESAAIRAREDQP